MNRLSALVLPVVLTVLCALPALAAPVLGIAPLGLELSARDKTTSLILTNSGDRPITLSVEVRRWSQENGEDQLRPTADLVAAPARLTLNPGGRQVVRLARLGPPSTGERSYRVLVTEVPTASAAGLRTVLQLSVPLFEGVLVGGPRLDAAVQGDRVVVHNTGERHVRLGRLEYRDAAGWHPLGLAYVLAGQFRSFAAPGALDLRYTSGDADVVPLPLR